MSEEKVINDTVGIVSTFINRVVCRYYGTLSIEITFPWNLELTSMGKVVDEAA
jgi:hypothetical protein